MDNKLQLLCIAESYAPDYGGGAAIYIRDICRHVASSGHEVRVVCVGKFDSREYEVHTDYDGAVRVDRVNLPYFKTVDPEGWELGISAWLTHQKRVRNLFEKYLKEWTPDIVHYNAARPFGEACLSVMQDCSIPIIAMFHEAWLICPRLMLLQSPLASPCSGPGVFRCVECLYSHYDGTRMRAALKLPRRIAKLGPLPLFKLWQRYVVRQKVQGGIGYSKFMTSMHKDEMSGIVKYIPLGIDLTGLPLAHEGRPRTPFRFGFMAGFQANKGIWHILDAAVNLKKDGLKFELHLWGPGQENSESEIASRNLQGVVFQKGVYSADQLWQVYNEIDVALMATTVCEPLGRIPLEAASVGAPTIAPAIGGITETIRHDVDGLLYRFRDKGDLEYQMRRILTEPDLFHRLVANLQIAPDTRAQVSEIEAFYLEVLAHAKGKEASAQN
jgi:glycosyltransferase involved in cell wall biosynthesis